MIKAILFDLDGTLLPMNQEQFTKGFFKGLIDVMQEYDSATALSSLYKGMEAMIRNNSNETNEEVFWETLYKIYGEKILNDKSKFGEFYNTSFEKLKETCSYNKYSNQIVKHLKDKGYTLVLATNPLFPSIATEKRMKWAGIDKNDFVLYTTYENSYHSKPNLEYYRDILKYIECNPDECIMIGNDVEEDMIAKQLGMKVFLLTDCLINSKNININIFEHGKMEDLIKYVNDLPNLK